MPGIRVHAGNGGLDGLKPADEVGHFCSQEEPRSIVKLPQPAHIRQERRSQRRHLGIP